MKITTIDQVLDLATTLNKVYESQSVVSHDLTINGIKSLEDVQEIARQQKGDFFPFEGYHCASVKLGKINFIITTKN